MRGRSSIGEPHSLFSIPRPSDVNKGKTTAGSTYTFNGAKRRKRAEVIIGVDGESISAYDIKGSQLINSHPIPPQSYLTARPCCVYRKASHDGTAHRFTYIALRNTLGGHSYRLICFSDASQRSSEAAFPGSASSTKWSYHIGDSSNQVTYIEPISYKIKIGSNDNVHAVLVIQEDGQITILSEDLQKELLKAKLGSGTLAAFGSESVSDCRVEFASIKDATLAQKGFLKDRLDILSVLGSGESSDEERLHSVKVLCLITRSGEIDQHHPMGRNLWTLSVHQRTTNDGHVLALQFLYSWKLPNFQPCVPLEASRYCFDVRNGILQELAQGSINIYSLLTTTVSTASKVVGYNEPIASFLPLSSSNLLVSSGKNCTIYNMPYKSVHGYRNVDVLEMTSHSSSKRKRALSEKSHGSVALLDYLRDFGVAIGVYGNEVVALPIVQELISTRSKHKHSSSLICSIDGAAPVPLSKTTCSESENKLQRQLARLDFLAKEGDVAGFEEHFFQVLRERMQVSGDTERFGRVVKSTDKLATILSSTDREHHELKGILGNEFYTSRDRQHTMPLARYVLTKLFHRTSYTSLSASLDNDSETSIRIVFMPPKLFAWLLLEGYCTCELLSSSLRNSNIDATHSVTATDLLTAIAQFDPSLKYLSCLVIHMKFDSSAMIYALRILIRSFNTPQAARRPHLEENAQIATPNQNHNHDLQTETMNLSLPSDATPLTSDVGHSIRANALKECLLEIARLCPPGQRVADFTTLLAKDDVLVLMELLRISLTAGGWTSRYLDFSSDGLDPGRDHEGSVTDICVLISSALDAVGTGGWLSEHTELKQHSGTNMLISYLRNETSAVLEGVQEAAYFKGYLKDFFRFEAEFVKLSKRRKGNNGFVGKGGTIRAASQTEGMLPLGLKSVQRISDTRVGAGGEIQMRSARDIGHKLNQKLGTYTFETIRV